MRHKFAKLGAAAAITVTGLGTFSTMKPVAASTFKTAIKRIKVKYLPGKGVKIWTSYDSGRFMGFRAKDGTEWNVVKTAVDKKGNLWYMVGDNEWIEARYTVDVETNNDNSANETTEKKSKITTLAKKAKAKVTKTKTKKAKVKKAKKIVDQALKKGKASSQAPSNASAICNLAKAQVGKNYVWGAEGPDTFDCSGLVQYVYAKSGVNLPRTTYDQVKVGQTVSMNQLQPGDLLFWGSTTAPYHVAIYIGNNQYVNAATPKQGVILQTLSTYYAPSIAKRVL